MEEKIIITFDFGTQSIRCALVNNKGQILGIVQEKYEEAYYSSKVGYAEQSFNTYYKYACIASKRLKELYPDLFDKAIGVTHTTFRDTFTLTDEKGNPLRDFILWIDTRKPKCEDKLPALNNTLFNLVGVKDMILYNRQLCRQNWIKENERELWDKAAKFASISAILNAKMTGNLVDSVSSCIGHVPMNYKKRCWMKKNELTYPIFNLEDDKLVDLCNVGDVVGYITKECSIETGLKEGLPLIATAADKSCETFGAGVIGDDSASLSFGTAVTINYITNKYIEPYTFLPSYPSLDDELYNCEVQIYRGCWMLTWFIDNYCGKEKEEAKKLGVSVEELLDEHIKDIPVGSDGLILIPYWNPPLKHPEYRGTIAGFLPDHHKYHFYRAILEGIGFNLYESFTHLEERLKRHTKYFVISGGASVSDDICQMVSDILGVRIIRPKEKEATTIGSSMGGFIGLKVFDSYEDAIKNMVSYEGEFIPNEENHKKYVELYKRNYKQTENHLHNVYKKWK